MMSTFWCFEDEGEMIMDTLSICRLISTAVCLCPRCLEEARILFSLLEQLCFGLKQHCTGQPSKSSQRLESLRQQLVLYRWAKRKQRRCSHWSVLYAILLKSEQVVEFVDKSISRILHSSNLILYHHPEHLRAVSFPHHISLLCNTFAFQYCFSLLWHFHLAVMFLLLFDTLSHLQPSFCQPVRSSQMPYPMRRKGAIVDIVVMEPGKSILSYLMTDCRRP